VDEKKSKAYQRVFLAVFAVATTGALVYTAQHRSELPANVPDASPEDLAAAAELRRQASDALHEGKSSKCVELLDEARKRDPVGDTAPEVAHMRIHAHFHPDDRPRD
jgi:hypothetical protein